ncbi:hypothetical protein [Rhizobium sp. Leaf341]|uniref:hypothetical protein n=1 Tax=Rhizobium sp. Leaf341 TaxID=1736344 RepID=UPI000713F92E|nr:hypothetical protein [Rhizobium sp. Leaf341]KQR75650.1 hypothetical protein ASG03_18350 [Rhizobium sp. Leaf341]
MSYIDVIRALANAPQGSRELDMMIATLLGWSRTEEESVEGAYAANAFETNMGAASPAVVGRVPAYTSNLQDAYELAEVILPGHRGGCGWEEGLASASIGENSNPVKAATPALAICVAALLLKATSERNSGASASGTGVSP